MEVIAMGDVHGRSLWKRVADGKRFDKLVLIGDYFDSRDLSVEEEFRTFGEIIAFKEAHPEEVVLLIGNHDFHYLPAARAVDEAYSRYREQYAYEIGCLFREHMDLFQMSYRWEDFLFTHAGVTNTWLDSVGYQGEDIEVFINDLFRRRPASFLFNGKDSYGDDVTQSPIWVRPHSLRKDAYHFETLKQVVGHTPVDRLEVVGERLYFIDTMGTSGEYLHVSEEGVSVERVN